MACMQVEPAETKESEATRKSAIASLQDPDKNVDSRKYLLKKYPIRSNAISLIDQPTRITTRSQTCIDVYARIADCDMIKHEASVLEEWKLEWGPDPIQLTCISNLFVLHNLLDKVDWSPVYLQRDVSDVFDRFHALLQSCICKSKKEIRPNNRFSKLKPWINDFFVYEN
ncbi:hypothetical protein J6590_079068 [Homalodisca vitripennis]|nr:hypothetical protein J6590_079068 [Homalodisca vitripennis]